MLKLNEPIRNQEIFIISLFLPLGSESVDPHIFVDPDPGSQNLTDPSDPDPN